MRLMHQLTLFPAFPQDSIFAKSRMPWQRHNTENLNQIFPEKELRGHNRSAYSAAGKYVNRSWEYINRSQTHECGNWDLGRAIPFLEIHKWDFHCILNVLEVSLHAIPSRQIT
jgi:hypothetical protein